MFTSLMLAVNDSFSNYEIIEKPIEPEIEEFEVEDTDIENEERGDE